MKYTTIFFDFEGKWGMPFNTDYDLEKTVLDILKILKQYHMKAVFCTCGKIIEVHPDIIKKIDNEGHEIAFRGYLHENFNKVSMKHLNQLLQKTENIFLALTGKKLLGFKALFLLGQIFIMRKFTNYLEKEDIN